MRCHFATLLFFISCVILFPEILYSRSKKHKRCIRTCSRQSQDTKKYWHASKESELNRLMDEGVVEVADTQGFEHTSNEYEDGIQEQPEGTEENDQQEFVDEMEPKVLDREQEPVDLGEQDEPSVESVREQKEKPTVDDKVLEESVGDVSEQSYQDDSDDPDAVNLQTKREQVMALIEKGEKYLKEHQPYEAFNMFTHNKDFIKGEIYLFVLDRDGTWLAHGQRSDLIWQNAVNMRDTFGSPFVKVMLKKAHRGGGWVTYQWRGATKISYVKEVNVKGRTFVIGAGYYPHSKADAVVSLVKGAVAMFKQAMKNRGTKEEAFSALSYPLGRFIFGDLYLYALDFKGIHMAHGDRPGLIGTNAINYKDATGKLVNQEIINKLKEGADGVWIEYISKNAPKRSYAEKVTDSAGNEYFIACGYYPDANRKQLVELVRRGYEYMKGHGESLAVSEFTDKKIGTFRYGDLYLIIFDMKGEVVAHGGNADFVGQNFYNIQDQDGRYYVREIIEQAKKQRLKSASGEADGAWVNYKIKNSFVSAYVKPIRLGLKEYVIVGGLFPITKKETTVLLVHSGAGFLRTETEKKAFAAFIETNGKFIQGDLGIFVYAFNGICLANADNNSFIWRNMLDAKDDKNMPYVQVLINTVRQGSGKVTYTINGIQRIVFIERVDKGERSYVVGSGYFK
ncbi:cache domain-containing protein [Candidatus Dependentiae bacterium]|nr:cache domain-containing protein [Candidatus Dependentiae bacterium]